MRVILHIQYPGGSKTVEVDRELSIGRTDLADLVLDDTGLSRVNTIVFIEDGEVLLTDENSTNGTFLNGERISGRPKLLRGGDEVKIGTHTKIRVEMEGRFDAGESRKSVTELAEDTPPVLQTGAKPPLPPALAAPADQSTQPPWILIAAAVMTFLILLFGGLAYWFVSRGGETPPSGPGSKTPPIVSGSAIPVRVIDPLGGEDEDDLDDLIASWETAEEEIKAENVADISVDSADTEIAELNVTAAFLAERQKKAFEDRPGEKGIRPAGLDVPKELFGDGVIKQKVKLGLMKSGGYQQPLDFAELAEKRLSRGLIEMPMAKNSFYLDVGGSASDSPFKFFSFRETPAEITVGSPKYGLLSKLASDFGGQKYDLNNASDRKQMRMRLLRMFNPRAKPILQELADAYFKQFGRPLRVTSLTRSMDYQILLNAGNANSFKVRDENSLPPHTSGCAFDLARKHMPVAEQNFVMKKLAEMEQAGKLDALIEYGVNACFHVFIYDDGTPPKM
ncbi:MAG: FHA domain-containing protein [Saprospiraceae bacterium]|nr:FHA domain-containing protein [Pyrinomonadaceae bacterium]